MFILDLNPEFTWPFTVRRPADGSFIEETALARFRLLPETAREKLLSEGGDVRLLSEALVGIEGAVGADGKPFDNCAVNLALVLDLMPFRIGLADAYAQAVYGATPSAAALGN